MVGLRNCQIYVGAVSGATHITDCTDCVINVACHQLRIHQTYRCQFYVFVATQPIIENVSELGFAPYRFNYPNISSHFEKCNFKGVNQFDQVQDFKWLRKDHSPNWYIVSNQNYIPLKEVS